LQEFEWWWVALSFYIALVILVVAKQQAGCFTFQFSVGRSTWSMRKIPLLRSKSLWQGVTQRQARDNFSFDACEAV
jgi:hypothetical protein